MPKILPDLQDAIEELNKPLWDGPYTETENGGLTYSLLSRFLCCRHRFWLRVIKGLKADEGFSYIMEYGNAWHYCEELFAAGKTMNVILASLKVYCIKLAQDHSTSSVEIDKLYNCIKVEFPIYVTHWAENEDVKKRTPISQEKPFVVAYTLPSGRVVVLRGKIDSIDLIDKGIWIQENKSKSDIKKEELQSDLLCDLQSMMYIIAVQELIKQGNFDSSKEKYYKKIPVKGVRYNVVRRPLSGMRFNIKKKKGRGKKKVGAETDEQFYTRLGTVIEANKPSFFARLKVEVTQKDVEQFKKWVLNPILEQLCDWYDSIKNNPFDPWNKWECKDDAEGFPNPKAGYEPVCPNKHHFLYPRGIFNPILEGRRSNMDELIYSGDERGFIRQADLFPELKVVQ